MPINGNDRGGGGGGGITGGTGSNGVRMFVSGSNLNSTGAYIPNYDSGTPYPAGSWITGNGTNGGECTLDITYGGTGPGAYDSSSWFNIASVNPNAGFNLSLLSLTQPWANRVGGSSNLSIGYEGLRDLVDASFCLNVGNNNNHGADVSGVSIFGHSVDTTAATVGSIYIANGFGAVGIRLPDPSTVNPGKFLGIPFGGGAFQPIDPYLCIDDVTLTAPNMTVDSGQATFNAVGGSVNLIGQVSLGAVDSGHESDQFVLNLDVSTALQSVYFPLGSPFGICKNASEETLRFDVAYNGVDPIVILGNFCKSDGTVMLNSDMENGQLNFSTTYTNNINQPNNQ